VSDFATWRVVTDERNPHDLPGGHAVIHGWDRGADPDRHVPTVSIEMHVGGLVLAELIVASLQATSKAAENTLAAHAAGTRGIDPRGWRYGPACATCHDTGTVRCPEIPAATGHCDCKLGRRLLDLHIWEKGRDNAEHEAQLADLHGGREHPDDPYVAPDGSMF
jgi:hypothetical protein